MAVGGVCVISGFLFLLICRRRCVIWGGGGGGDGGGLVSLVYKINFIWYTNIYIKFIQAFFFLRKGCRPWGYIARLFLCVLLCYLLLCFYDIHIIYIFIYDMINSLYRYMCIIYFLSLVMVAIGINSSVVMVSLVLNRTPCRSPGMREDNCYRPAYLDYDKGPLTLYIAASFYLN